MSNTPQTEAQRLADAIDPGNEGHKIILTIDVAYAAAELRRLDAENQQLKTSLALVQQHHATAWNRGHQAGIRAGESAVKQATDAVKADAWGNTQLTNALMQAEAERDQLRAQLAKAAAEEREACAKVCEEFMRLTLDAQLGEPSDLHNVMLRQIANLGHGELAGAIRARSNT